MNIYNIIKINNNQMYFIIFVNKIYIYIYIFGYIFVDIKYDFVFL